MLKNRFILSVLAMVCTSTVALAIYEDGYNYASYTNVTHANNDGHVSITVSDGANLSMYDMYETTLEQKDYQPKTDDGVLIGGASGPLVYNNYTLNAPVKSVSITLNGGEGLNSILGMGFASSRVEGAVNITVNDGDHGTIIGGVSYPSAANATAPEKTASGFQHPTSYAENDITITVNGGHVDEIVAGHSGSSSKIHASVVGGEASNPSVIGGDVKVVINGGTVGTSATEDAINTTGSSHAVSGNVSYEINGGTVTGLVYGGAKNSYSSVGGNTEITITGGTIDGTVFGGGNPDDYSGGADAPLPEVKGNTKITMTGGNVTGNIYGGGEGDIVKGTSSITISGDAVVGGDVFGGGKPHDNAEEGISTNSEILGTSVTITGGTIKGNVYGGSEKGTIGEGGTEVVIDGGDVEGNVYGAGKGDTVKGGAKVRLLSGNVGGVVDADGEGSSVAGEAIIEVGSDEKPYEGSVGGLTDFDQIVVANNSFLMINAGNVFDTKHHSFTLNVNNMNKAALTLGSGASIIVAPGDSITLNITSNGKLPGGKYKLIDGSAIGKGMTRATAGTVDLSGWSAGTVKVTGGLADFDDLVWDEENNILYLTLEGEAVVVPAEPHASMDAAVLANWGVYQSAQAFTATLWGPRSNAVELAPATTTDTKGRTITVDAPAKGRTIAWATAYSHSSRIGSVGADYSIYGAALGVERKFAKGSSVGLAFGYDWGKTKPFSTTAVDQETMHVGVYGRPVEWKLNEKSAIAIDLAAVYGHTDSEHDDFIGDWSQNSWLLDMRATYQRAINERTTASVFAGVQYYTHDDDTVDGVTIDSMQNMRLMVGAGVSYAIKRATVFGEAALHYDTLRHNPNAKENDIRYKASNPGRFGGRIGTGVSYQVKDNFNVYGTYNFSGADDSVEHNVNIGASMSF